MPRAPIGRLAEWTDGKHFPQFWPILPTRIRRRRKPQRSHFLFLLPLKLSLVAIAAAPWNGQPGFFSPPPRQCSFETRQAACRVCGVCRVSYIPYAFCILPIRSPTRELRFLVREAALETP